MFVHVYMYVQSNTPTYMYVNMYTYFTGNEDNFKHPRKTNSNIIINIIINIFIIIITIIIS